MKLSAPLVILASVTGAMAEGCYSGGQAWATEACKDSFKGAIRDLCNNGKLGGYFNHGATKTDCAKCPTAGIRVNLAVGWKGQGGLTLRNEDCAKELSAILDKCYYGGEYTVADWYFK
jgi:hypothetical protein